MGVNVEGVVNALLADIVKVHCEFCNGTTFQLAWQMDENTDLPSKTKAYKWENSAPTLPYGNMQTLLLLCQCGEISGKLVWCLDVCSAMTTPAVSATHIACAVLADNLKGLYLTPLGGTSAGVSYKVASNTKADPTVITVAAGINDNTNGEVFLLSSFKVF